MAVSLLPMAMGCISGVFGYGCMYGCVYGVFMVIVGVSLDVPMGVYGG